MIRLVLMDQGLFLPDEGGVCFCQMRVWCLFLPDEGVVFVFAR